MKSLIGQPDVPGFAHQNPPQNNLTSNKEMFAMTYSSRTCSFLSYDWKLPKAFTPANQE